MSGEVLGKEKKLGEREDILAGRMLANPVIQVLKFSGLIIKDRAYPYKKGIDPFRKGCYFLLWSTCRLLLLQNVCIYQVQARLLGY